MRTIGSQGSGASQLNQPIGVAFDSAGRIIVADLRQTAGIIECSCCATATAATYEPLAAKAVEMGSLTHHRERLRESPYTGAAVSPPLVPPLALSQPIYLYILCRRLRSVNPFIYIYIHIYMYMCTYEYVCTHSWCVGVCETRRVSKTQSKKYESCLSLRRIT